MTVEQKRNVSLGVKRGLQNMSVEDKLLMRQRLGDKSKEAWQRQEYKDKMHKRNTDRWSSPTAKQDFSSKISGANNYQWRNGKTVGAIPGYQAVHKWVKQTAGPATSCVYCKMTDKKRYEWANVSGDYLYDMTDWMQLCRGCHMKYDNK